MKKETEPFRALICGVIQQAAEDFLNETEYKSVHKRAEMQEARVSALHFLRSRSFMRICQELKLPANKIKRELFK